jgi:hypothetical protein
MSSGLFALILAVTGRFLPHDEQFLGMSAEELCAVQGCRIVHFMIHDRVSFGGALLAIGMLYFWLTAFPLREGQPWAWWLLCLSGAVGFLSFFAYVGFGYLDTWHALASLALFICYAFGLVKSRAALSERQGGRSLFQPSSPLAWSAPGGFGRTCLLAVCCGLIVGGLTIMLVGMTCIFVPQDIQYLGLSAAEMRALNPSLLPLIAHDRAGFGGAVCCCGLTLFFCIWCGTPSRSLWLVLGLVGLVGFGTAIGVHPAIGYSDAVHLAPAVLGASVYLTGMIFTFRHMVVRRRDEVSEYEPTTSS